MGPLHAELERLKISERVVRGRIQAAKSGSVQVAGRPPYGYDLVKENGKFHLEINEEEARIVRLVYQWYTEGDGEGEPLTLAEIARRLTEMKVPTYNDTPTRPKWPKRNLHLGRWHKATIHKILQKRAYIGTWVYRKHRKVGDKNIPTSEDEQIGVSVPPIIDEDTWHAAQRRVELNRQNARRNRKYYYLLAGHVRCGKCEARCFGRTVQRPKNLHHYYSCGARTFKDRYHHTCDMPYFRGEPVDDAVWTWIKGLLTNPEMLELGLRNQQTAMHRHTKPIEDQLTIVKEKIASWQVRQERLLDLYLDGKVAVDAWEKRNNEMLHTLNDLQDQKRVLTIKLDQPGISDQRIQDIKEFAHQITERIDLVDDDFDTKRRIIEILNVEVAVNVDDEGAQYLQASCVLGDNSLSIESIATHRHRR